LVQALNESNALQEHEQLQALCLERLARVCFFLQKTKPPLNLLAYTPHNTVIATAQNTPLEKNLSQKDEVTGAASSVAHGIRNPDQQLRDWLCSICLLEFRGPVFNSGLRFFS